MGASVFSGSKACYAFPLGAGPYCVDHARAILSRHVDRGCAIDPSPETSLDRFA